MKYNGSAYSSYSSNIVMATSIKLTVNARLENGNGILYYFSQYKNGTGNFILVQLVNRIVALSFSEGRSVTTIRYITCYLSYYLAHWFKMFEHTVMCVLFQWNSETANRQMDCSTDWH